MTLGPGRAITEVHKVPWFLSGESLGSWNLVFSYGLIFAHLNVLNCFSKQQLGMGTLLFFQAPYFRLISHLDNSDFFFKVDLQMHLW